MTVLLALTCPPARAEPRADDLVDLTSIAPGIQVDIRYATADNFTGKVIYPRARCLLRRAVARRLAPLGAVEVSIAQRPTLEEMLALVDSTAANIGE